MSMDTVPSSMRHLRACLMCSLIKTVEQFEADGCENCDKILGMRGNRDQVSNCTSTTFDGMIALTEPETSWCSKWLRISHCVPGVYAISVSGRLPPEIVRDIKASGDVYRPRDRSNAN